MNVAAENQEIYKHDVFYFSWEMDNIIFSLETLRTSISLRSCYKKRERSRALGATVRGVALVTEAADSLSYTAHVSPSSSSI